MQSTKHARIEEELLALLRDLEPGARIPPERELCTRFGAARQTVRRVLDELARDGLLDRRQGAGTFVAKPRVQHDFHVQSFTEDMAARRMRASSRLLGHRVAAAGARLGTQLRLSPGDEVLTLERLRLADGEPMALETTSVPVALVPGIDVASLEERSLYETFREDFGIEIAGGTQTMTPTVTDPVESELLTVPPLSPALLVERVIWDQQGRRIERVRSVYRGDRYKFHLDLAARPGR